MIVTDPRLLTNEEAKRQLVFDCEAAFEKQLTDLCDSVCGREDLRAIMLSGPTCSGKTTTANKLIRSLRENGKDVHVVSVDDFYYDRMYLMARSEQLGFDVDFESIVSIDLPFFKMCMQSLLAGEKTLLPRYDFKLGRRNAYEAYQMKENSILLVEGIQAIYPEIVSVFSHIPSVSVFINAARSIVCGKSTFDPIEVRLVRRLVRDSRHRGACAEFTFSLWKSVTDNEKRSILPYMDTVTYRLDSSMGYEPYIMRAYLIPLLEKDISSDSPYYKEARSLIDRLQDLPVIDPTGLPNSSVYHEFIG